MGKINSTSPSKAPTQGSQNTERPSPTNVKTQVVAQGALPQSCSEVEMNPIPTGVAGSPIPTKEKTSRVAQSQFSDDDWEVVEKPDPGQAVFETLLRSKQGIEVKNGEIHIEGNSCTFSEMKEALNQPGADKAQVAKVWKELKEQMNAQIEEKKEFVTSCATIKDAYKSYCTLRDTPRTGSTGDKYTLNVRESQAEQKMAAGIIDINYSLREKIPNVDYDRRQDYPRIIENINTKIQTKQAEIKALENAKTKCLG